jgi:HEAT repeat protein
MVNQPTRPTDIRALIDQLGNPNGIQAGQARRALVSLGTEATPFLIEALDSSNHRTRWQAAKALSLTGDPHAVPALIDKLEDDEFDLRWLAAEALVACGTASLPPLLERLRQSAASAWLREGAHHVLSDLCKRSQRAETACQKVVQALEGGEAAGVGHAADEALAQLEG